MSIRTMGRRRVARPWRVRTSSWLKSGWGASVDEITMSAWRAPVQGGRTRKPPPPMQKFRAMGVRHRPVGDDEVADSRRHQGVTGRLGTRPPAPISNARRSSDRSPPRVPAPQRHWPMRRRPDACPRRTRLPVSRALRNRLSSNWSDCALLLGAFEACRTVPNLTLLDDHRIQTARDPQQGRRPLNPVCIPGAIEFVPADVGYKGQSARHTASSAAKASPGRATHTSLRLHVESAWFSADAGLASIRLRSRDPWAAASVQAASSRAVS